MAKPKTPASPVPQPASYTPSDYEQGVIDVLEILRQEVYRLSDAHRTATRLLWDAPPEVQSLLSFANPSANIAGDVENRVVRRAMASIDARRTVSNS